MNKSYQYRRRPVLKDAPLYQRYPRTFVITTSVVCVGIFYSRFIYELFIKKRPQLTDGGSSEK